MSEPIFSERPPEEPKPGPEEPKKGPFRPKKGPFRPKKGPFRPKQDRKPYIRPPEEPKRLPEEPKPGPEEPKQERPLFFQKPKLPYRKRKRKRRYRKRKRPLPLTKQIDYKDTKLLDQFTSDQGKILSKRATKLHLKQQRLITLGIKKARILSFLPFTYNNKNIERIKLILIRNAKLRNKKKKFKSKRKNRSFKNC